MAAARWSWLFGPLFGAILLDRNWHSMNQRDRGRGARFFLWGCIAFFVLAVGKAFVEFDPTMDKAMHGIFKIVGLVLIALCGFLASTQRRFLAEEVGGTYLKRSWLKPLAIGFGILVPLLALIVLGALQDPLMCRLVERDARPLLAQEFSRRPPYEGVSIQKVEFDHRKGDDYEGVMVVRTNTGESSVPLKAHLEGGRLEVRWPVDLSTAWPPE